MQSGMTRFLAMNLEEQQKARAMLKEALQVKNDGAAEFSEVDQATMAALSTRQELEQTIDAVERLQIEAA